LTTIGLQVSDVDLIIHNINDLLEDCENLIENLETEIKSGLTDLEKLSNRLRTKFRRLMDKDTKPKSRGCEVIRNKIGFCLGQKRRIGDLVSILYDKISGRDFTNPRQNGYGALRTEEVITV
jgi:archaellum component FlaC